MIAELDFGILITSSLMFFVFYVKKIRPYLADIYRS